MDAHIPPTYARICVNLSQVSGTYDYKIPNNLIGLVRPGCLVEVPFGPRLIQGIVLDIKDSTEIDATREIFSLLDPEPVLTSRQLQMAEWLSQNTLATLSQCVDLMVLPGLSKQADVIYSPGENQLPDNAKPIHKKLISLVDQKGEIRGRQIDLAFGMIDWRNAARSLTQQNILTVRHFLPRPSLHPRMVRRVQLAIKAEDIDYNNPPVFSRSEQRMKTRRAVMEFLASHPEPIDLQWLRANLPYDLQNTDLAALEEAEWIRLWETEVIRDPVDKFMPEIFDRHTLTPAQSSAWDQISFSIDANSNGILQKPILVFGVTGSGKTELYLRAVEETLALGKRVLWLVPEISLTPQTISRILHRFPGQVGLVHSRLTEGERYDTWRRIRAGKISIVVGARSALFSPINDLGLIIIDECHDSSFYQGEIQPYYNAIDFSVAYAETCNAVCIMGTATPEVSRYQKANVESWRVLHLPERIAQDKRLPRLASVHVVDMRNELRQGNRSIFSYLLQQQLIETLKKGNQSILFLNRRGSAGHVFCRVCGYVMRCPRCNLPMTAHGKEDILSCHHCNYRKEKPVSCSQCGSNAFRQLGIGTETVEREINKLLPDARVLRWDSDSAQQSELKDIGLIHFRNRHYDILIGTQMVTKGLDFPGVSLVGMILADVGLNLPDFRSSERVFQLLVQVAGRAGRGSTAGDVILQTFQPDHKAIEAAANQNYDQFYQWEIEQRRSLAYPPFSRLTRIEIRESKPDMASEKAARLEALLRDWLDQDDCERVDLIGPVPCFYERIRGLYRWQIILRGMNYLSVLQKHSQELQPFRVELDPLNLL